MQALAATVSGAVTSGLGYSVWYYLLGSIRAVTAALAQLSVPAIAAVGGALLLLEPLDQRVVLSTLLTVGGIAFVLVVRGTRPRARDAPVGEHIHSVQGAPLNYCERQNRRQ